ncbi:Protein of unknown function [Spirosomataceae bacterium TFI 002]|nr:Protein of unknown function [Spirosomataceae bacterium TFI 002]
MKLNYVSWTIFLITVIYVVFIYGGLPDKVPAHFDLQGNPNRYDGKGAFWGILGIELFVLGIFQLVSKMDPEAMNYPVKLTKENKEFQFKNNQITLQGMGVLIALLILSIVRYMHQKTINPDYPMIIVDILIVSIFVFTGWRIYLSVKNK